MRDSKLYYSTIYNHIDKWVVDGQLQFTGTRSNQMPDDLDIFIFKLFGLHFEGQKPHYKAFNSALMRGKLNVGWLFSEHGLTLLKMKIARMK